jgi:flavin reductase (DIM6/NTAB) family NADH-FMN oxidoreductase RutF
VSVDPLAFRRAAGYFATGVTVVTTRHGSVDYAMTANSFTSVSLSPVLVLISIEQAARFHDAVIASGVVGVNILSVEQEELSRWFATRGRPVDARAAGFAHHDGPLTGVVMFDDSLATLECRLQAAHQAGDHTLIVAQVVAVEVEQPDARPLIYYDSTYRTLS